jgi:uncharacterized membrane protein YhaH (DUF805 family)
MGWIRFFFDPRGRINRAKFWLFFAFYYGLGAATAVAGWAFSQTQVNSIAYWSFSIVSTIIGVLAIAGIVIVPIKRLHDRDRSGWWWIGYLLAPVPLIGAAAGATQLLPLDAQTQATLMLVAISIGFSAGLWLMIELGGLPGTPGPNRFGPDPLARD